jgi:hypothetical protein
MIEDERRFSSYIAEVDQVNKSGMTFRQWDELSVQSSFADQATGLVYIPAAWPE